MGSFEFPNPLVTYSAVSETANIGSPSLADFSLTFDQKKQVVRLVKAPGVKVFSVSPIEAQEYVGTYGPRVITVTGGQLYSQRIGGPTFKMLRLSEDEFALEGVPEARIKFGRDAAGKIIEMKIRNPAGEWETIAKSK